MDLPELRRCGGCQDEDRQLGQGNDQASGSYVGHRIEPEREPGHDDDDGGRDGRPGTASDDL